MRIGRRTLLLAAAAFAAAARAQPVEVLTLRHRSAEELLPLLQPFVAPGGALSGRGSELYLRASPAAAQQIRELVARLDRPPRQLQITLRRELDGQDSERSLRADGSVVVSSRRSSGGLQVETREQRVETTRRSGQSVRVSEGGRAVIAIGTAIPFTFNQYVPTAQGLTEVRGTTYYDAVTAFAVRPQLAGEIVTLELAPTEAVLTPRGVERMELMTRVQGRLGEWIALGGADLAEQTRRQEILGSDARASAGSRGVWVMVEDVTGR